MLKINNVEYNVGITSLTRQMKKEYKYKVVTEDGITHSEIKNVKAIYSLILGNLNQSEYSALRTALLIDSDNEVEVIIEFGDFYVEITALTEIGSDGILYIDDSGTPIWSGMSITFESVDEEGVT